MGNCTRLVNKNMAQSKSSDERFRFQYKSIKIVVVRNDITREQVDSIVNAANEHLAHGGGVAGAISSRGGPEVQRESSNYVRKHGIVNTGQVAVTGPGRLPCKYIIHAVGPIWSNGRSGEDDELESAILNSFKKANELKCETISIPAISSGIFGYPKPRCAKVMIRSTKAFIDEVVGGEVFLKEIRLTNFDSETTELMEEELRKFADNPEQVIELGEIKEKKQWGGWGYSGSTGLQRSWGSNYEKESKKDKSVKKEEVKNEAKDLQVSSISVATAVSGKEKGFDDVEEVKTEEVVTEDLDSQLSKHSHPKEINPSEINEESKESKIQDASDKPKNECI